MTVVPAVVAGVEEIVVCTPAADATARSTRRSCTRRGKAGATHVAKTGGAQAVAAMAYGTESIPSVDRIVGPGNVYVTEAKRQVAGFVGIDGLAGPSELAIVADGDVDPRMAALDLIAQAEHDPERVHLLPHAGPGADREGERGVRARAAAGRPRARSSSRRCATRR